MNLPAVIGFIRPVRFISSFPPYSHHNFTKNTKLTGKVTPGRIRNFEFLLIPQVRLERIIYVLGEPRLCVLLFLGDIIALKFTDLGT